MFKINPAEIRVTFARSSGAGGQNVNKVASKVIIHWSIGQSQILTWEEKNRLRTKLANKINSNDEVVMMSEEERSQPQNRLKAITNLQTLVNIALHVPKKRRPTKPTYSSKLKRLETKKLRSKIKTLRKSIE